MTGKLSGSPFHVESARYKYATEQSDVPVSKSEFNETITKCTNCAYNYELRKTAICTNIDLKKLGGNHCEGFLDCKTVYDLIQFKNNSLEKYYCFRNHRIIRSLALKMKTYKTGSNNLIDSYCGKRWVITGIDKTYNKEDLFFLIEQMKGKHWSNLEHWDLIDSDIVINMGSNPYKLKELNKKLKQGFYKDRDLPRIITIQEFREDIIRMLRSFTETA